MRDSILINLFSSAGFSLGVTSIDLRSDASSSNIREASSDRRRSVSYTCILRACTCSSNSRKRAFIGSRSGGMEHQSVFVHKFDGARFLRRRRIKNSPYPDGLGGRCRYPRSRQPRPAPSAPKIPATRQRSELVVVETARHRSLELPAPVLVGALTRPEPSLEDSDAVGDKFSVSWGPNSGLL